MSAARLGVCSWSLRPQGPVDLVSRVRATGVDGVQLALDPIRRGEWDETETSRALAAGGISLVSGMMGMAGEDYSSLESICATGGVRLDERWEENLAAAQENAALARRLGIDLVTLHAGFIPHDGADPERGRMLERLRQVADAFGGEGVRVGFETGQETAATLLEALRDLERPSVGVNFDPANMILYGMGDPVEAVGELAPHVVQVHIKDAVATTEPGTWGQEVPVGDGQVDWAAFLMVINERAGACDWVIEREAGENRTSDIVQARQLLERHRG